MPTERLHAVTLHFDAALNDLGRGKELRDGLSAALQLGDALWLANDETASLERLTRVPDGGGARFARHAQFPLADVLALPRPPVDGEPPEEVDVEGLAHDGGYLWLVGSHSRRRRKPKRSRDPDENRDRLASAARKGNRFVLARVPLDPATGAPARAVERGGERLTAARLRGGDRGNALTKALSHDEHLAPFLAVPGKDNGFDVEGLAVDGSRVLLGLRGPVLRGWATILELDVAADGDELTLRKLGPHGRRYRKHFLDLGGLGVRDLVAVGPDLLVLAGPTMHLDGPVRVLRWRGGAAPEEESVVFADALDRVIELPYGAGADAGRDHAEGLTLYAADGGEPGALLVVYDSPSDARRGSGAGRVDADVFALP